MSWLWDTPIWSRYCSAYGRTDEHFGSRGNLVMSLDGPVEMWRHVRNGHRSNIKRASQGVNGLVLGASSADFDVYERLHKLAYGEVRSQETYDIQREMMVAHGLVSIVRRDYDPVAVALFYTFEQGSYYASAARLPDLEANDGAGHVALWMGAVELCRRGYRWLDLGPLPDKDASEKEKAISHFKRGFGGTMHHWPLYPGVFE